MSKIKKLRIAMMILSTIAGSYFSGVAYAVDSSHLGPENVSPAHMITQLVDCQQAPKEIAINYGGVLYVAGAKTVSGQTATSCPPGFVSQSLKADTLIVAGIGSSTYQNVCCRVVVSYE